MLNIKHMRCAKNMHVLITTKNKWVKITVIIHMLSLSKNLKEFSTDILIHAHIKHLVPNP